LDLLIRATGQNLFLPFYHTVSNQELIHIKHLYPVRDEKRFKEDLHFLLKHFKPIAVDELSEIASGEKSAAENSFFLSFDDGLSEIYDVIAPVLKEMGIPAAFFVNSSFVDNKELFYRFKCSILVESIQSKPTSEAVQAKIDEVLVKHSNSTQSPVQRILAIKYDQKGVLDEIGALLEVDFAEYLNSNKPYLTTQQIEGLIDDGFVIGAHSEDHPEYSCLSLEEQLSQTQCSMQFLNEKFKIDSKLFSFPFTDYGVSKDFFRNIFDTGNNIADISFGSAGLKKESFSNHFHRVAMDSSNLPAEKIIATEYLYYLLKAPFGKNSIART